MTKDKDEAGAMAEGVEECDESKKCKPSWQSDHSRRCSWFEQMSGGVALNKVFDEFDVLVLIEGENIRYYLEKGQEGSALWALEWISITKGNRLSVFAEKAVPGTMDERVIKSSDYELILESFREHGIHKRSNLGDESIHPFIHHLLIACRSGGKLIAKRKCCLAVVQQS